MAARGAIAAAASAEGAESDWRYGAHRGEGRRGGERRSAGGSRGGGGGSHGLRLSLTTCSRPCPALRRSQDGEGEDEGLPSFFDARRALRPERESGARLRLPQWEEPLLPCITSPRASSPPSPSLGRPHLSAVQRASTGARRRQLCLAAPLRGLFSRLCAFRLRGVRQVRRVLPHFWPTPRIAGTAARSRPVLRRACLSLCRCKGSLLLEPLRWVREEMSERRLRSSCPRRRFLAELL